jgi:endoglucanase Acf2
MVETINSVIGSDVRNIYLACLEKQNNASGSLMVQHLGEFSTDFINGLTESVEEMMVSNGDSKKVIKRVFSILIEGLQNVRLHGEKDEQGNQYSFLFVVKGKNTYKIIMGNLINHEDQVIAERYLDKINLMSAEELKSYYLEILDNSFFSRKGGAGLGFLTMRMKSEQKLAYSFDKLNDNLCFFTVEITLLRD